MPRQAKKIRGAAKQSPASDDDAIPPSRQENDHDDDDATETKSPTGEDRSHLKPLLKVGDEVYSAWWLNEDRSDDPTWLSGIIKSCKEVEQEDDGQYGPTRMYDVTFDDGNEGEIDGIEDRYVFPKEDYLLSTKRGDREWVGVNNVVDENSTDQWAKIVGWYVATIDGDEQSFSRLSDAVEAYDDAVVQRGGKSTKESDLNLPENWPELFNNVQDNTEGEGGKSNVGKAESPPKKKPRRGRKSKHSEPQTDGDDSSAAKSPKEVKVTSEEDKDDVKDNGKACPHCKKCFYSRNGFEYHIDNQVCQQPETKKEFPCLHCKKMFTSEKRLENHIANKVCQRQAKKGRKTREKPKDSTPTPSDKKGGSTKKNAKTEDSSAKKGSKKKAKTKGTNASPKRGGSSKKKVKSEDSPTPSESKVSGQKRKSSRISTAKAKKSEEDSLYTEVGSDVSDSPDGEPLQKKAKKRKSTSSSDVATKNLGKKFNILEPGSKFITKYGVVEVIVDNRIPSDHHKSTIDVKLSRSFLKRKERFHERKDRALDQIAAGTRHRREELKSMYLKSRGPNTSAPITQKKVWDLYCKTLSPNQILTEGLTWGWNNEDLSKRGKVEKFTEEDPRLPKDYYPDRIVECKLVEDKRDIMVAKLPKDPMPKDYDGTTDNLKFRMKFRPKSKKVTVPMRLFIARRELTKECTPSSSNFLCGGCGEGYAYRDGVRHHLRGGICGAKKDDEKTTRLRERIESIESKALSGSGCRDILLKNMHGSQVVEIRSIVNRPPGFGNPHKIKEHKKHKMPPWLVFNDQRSSMYPEIYASLEFRRGSQNRNHFNKKKEDADYVSNNEKSRLRKLKNKKKHRMSDPCAKTESALSTDVSTAKNTTLISTAKKAAASAAKKAMASAAEKSSTSAAKKATVSAAEKSSTSAARKATASTAEKSTTKQPEKDSDPPFCIPAMPPLPSIGNPDEMDVDFGDSGGNDEPIVNTVTEPMTPVGASNGLNGAKETTSKKKKKTPVGASDGLNGAKETTSNKKKKTASEPSASKPSSRRKKGTSISSKKKTVVIDTQVLAAECETGRYPTINRFHGEHAWQCTLCKEDGDTPLVDCDFCKNSTHPLCLDKRMLLKDPQVVIRENGPDDMPMCHECITTCLFRRWRAESRRETKWQHELSKAGLGSVPEAASIREEVKLKGSEETGDDEPTYQPCPDGGPGGLICCSYCADAYSRFLSNTAKEMEGQSVSRVGQEVSEILELLVDAKRRLQIAADVTQANEERRGLLDKNQTAHEHDDDSHDFS